MVKYSCGVCNQTYNTFEEAEKCEKKGVIGPILQSGLLLEDRRALNEFLIFYKELENSGHERNYHCQKIILMHHAVWSFNGFCVNNSEFNEFFRKYKSATEKDLSIVNQLIKDEAYGTKGIGEYMKRLGIKELHNKCNLEDFL
jgi:hypothetical protein